MSYATYTTEAIVCGSLPNNTSDKLFVLFTKEMGMILATARSVREEKSKQRYALQDFSRVRVTLLKAKSGWKIGSVESLLNYYSNCVGRAERGLLVQAIKLLKQYIHGEEKVEAIYQDLVSLLDLTGKSIQEPRDLIDIFTLRLLYRLGYVSANPTYSDHLNTDDWTTKKSSEQISATISEARRASQL